MSVNSHGYNIYDVYMGIGASIVTSQGKLCSKLIRCILDKPIVSVWKIAPNKATFGAPLSLEWKLRDSCAGTH